MKQPMLSESNHQHIVVLFALTIAKSKKDELHENCTFNATLIYFTMCTIASLINDLRNTRLRFCSQKSQQISKRKKKYDFFSKHTDTVVINWTQTQLCLSYN